MHASMRKFYIKHEKQKTTTTKTICSVNCTLTITVYCKLVNCKPPYLIHICFEHNHTPSGKKMVTGVQVITASQVQSIGCRWKAILSHTCCLSVQLYITKLGQSTCFFWSTIWD